MFLRKFSFIFLIVIFVFPLFAFSSSVEKEPVGTIYLTFDADMTPYMKDELLNGKIKEWYSPKIISYLKAEKIPASVFTTGMFAEVYPDLIKDLGSNPLFSIENHTYSHKSFSSPCYKPEPVTKHTEKVLEITKTQEIIKNLTGKEPKYVRLPGLCRTEQDETLIEKLGLIPSNVGIISGDVKQHDYRKIVNSVLHQAHSGDNIIIMHLGGPHAPSIEKALEIFIPELLKKGYIFKHL
jgi:peptidoglycan/xylan/chitin deacetylase (PgdA/CDA1 family)